MKSVVIVVGADVQDGQAIARGGALGHQGVRVSSLRGLK
jgi:hypothetical protein